MQAGPALTSRILAVSVSACRSRRSLRGLPGAGAEHRQLESRARKGGGHGLVPGTWSGLRNVVSEDIWLRRPLSPRRPGRAFWKINGRGGDLSPLSRLLRKPQPWVPRSHAVPTPGLAHRGLAGNCVLCKAQ